MSKRLAILTLFVALVVGTFLTVKAEDEKVENSPAHSDEHGHEQQAGDEHQAGKEDEHGSDKAESHDEEEGHAHEEKDEHGHEEEGHGENRAVGPDKGITEANEKLGFRLSAEAVKNFGITTKDVSGPGTFTLPRSSIFFGLQERNIYRIRNGFYQRIDFVTLSKSFSQLTISVSDLKAGDKIVLSGLGFLRIAEIAAFGGIGEGHAH